MSSSLLFANQRHYHLFKCIVYSFYDFHFKKSMISLPMYCSHYLHSRAKSELNCLQTCPISEEVFHNMMDSVWFRKRPYVSSRVHFLLYKHVISALNHQHYLLLNDPKGLDHIIKFVIQSSFFPNLHNVGNIERTDIFVFCLISFFLTY